MAAAMFVPAVALLALFWLGLLAAHLVIPLQMLLMLPAMIAVMLYHADQSRSMNAPCAPRGLGRAHAASGNA
jgi:hypothetical protein